MQTFPDQYKSVKGTLMKTFRAEGVRGDYESTSQLPVSILIDTQYTVHWYLQSRVISLNTVVQVKPLYPLLHNSS